MFGSLKQGNICYILIKGEKPILKIGTVESVSNPMPKYPTYNPSVPFGAQQETVIDAKIKKSRMDEFKRFAAIFGFTEENIENILSKEKEMVGK